MMLDTYLAIDFGAGSGRVMAGFVSAGMVDLEEIYRFPNRQVIIFTGIFRHCLLI